MAKILQVGVGYEFGHLPVLGKLEDVILAVDITDERTITQLEKPLTRENSNLAIVFEWYNNLCWCEVFSYDPFVGQGGGRSYVFAFYDKSAITAEWISRNLPPEEGNWIRAGYDPSLYEIFGVAKDDVVRIILEHLPDNVEVS